MKLYRASYVGLCWKIQDTDTRQVTETKHNLEKQTTQNTAKQNYPGLVTFYLIGVLMCHAYASVL